MNDQELIRSSKFETEVLEFKEAKAGFDFNKLGKYFSALCNEANLKRKPCAWLIFGVADKHHAVVGTKYRELRKAGRIRNAGNIRNPSWILDS